jgi:hypothetical protein
LLVKSIETPEQNPERRLLEKGLRENLPRQEPHRRLLGQLISLMDNSTTVKSNTKSTQPGPVNQAPAGQQSLNPSLQAAIKTFIDKLPVPETVQTAKGIKQAIQQSGLFLEHGWANNKATKTSSDLGNITQTQQDRLKSPGDQNAPNQNKPTEKVAPATARQTAHQRLEQIAQKMVASPHSLKDLKQNQSLQRPALATDTPVPGKTSSAIKNAITQQQPIQPNQQGNKGNIEGQRYPANSAVKTIETVTSSDFKANLLNLANAVYRSMPLQQQQYFGPSLGIPLTTSVQQAQATDSQNLSGQLYTAKGEIQKQDHVVLPAMPSGTSKLTADSSMELQLLQQILASMARTQFQQLSSVAGQSATTADLAPTTHLNLDIPIINGNQVDTVSLQIDEELLGHDSGDTQQAKLSAWRVMLSFDFETLGMFYAQLRLVEDSVSTTFWAEHKTTVSAIKNEFKSLKESLTETGVVVNEMRCYQGEPPETDKAQVEKSLISVHT